MSRLEKISKALAGETLTGAARGVGEAIGYVGAGGDFADVPEVLRDAIKEQRKRTELGTQGEKDAYGALQALGLISNPLSQIGAATDFAGALPDLVSAIPERAKAYIAGEPEPVGQIAESGLKRRLAKGGAQAEYAKANQLERAKKNIMKRDIDYPLQQGSIDKFVPIQSTGAKWGPGEGKFQVIDDYNTRAYDLTKKGDRDVFMAPERNVIEGNPHELGIEFHTTHGLSPEYRGKGYGKAIYQNMADVYGGGISDTLGTSELARNVYKSLGAIDTGIPSYGGTRQALPTTAMKNDPAVMAEFEAKVKEYADSKLNTGSYGSAKDYSLKDALDEFDTATLERFKTLLKREARDYNEFVHAHNILRFINNRLDTNLGEQQLPDKFRIDDILLEKKPNSVWFKLSKP